MNEDILDTPRNILYIYVCILHLYDTLTAIVREARRLNNKLYATSIRLGSKSKHYALIRNLGSCIAGWITLSSVCEVIL